MCKDNQIWFISTKLIIIILNKNCDISDIQDDKKAEL